MQPDFFATLAEPESPEQFATALESICRSAGLQHHLVIRLRGVGLEETIQVFENAPKAAGDFMPHASIARLVDRMRRAGPPVLFGAGAEAAPEVPGYTSGVAVLQREPRGAALFYFGCNAPALPPHQVLPAMRAVLLAASYGLQGLVTLHARACPLTHGELECLRQFVDGQSARDSAQALGLSARTVEHMLESIRKRFGVKTTIAAACQAINQGWLDAPRGSGVAVSG